jgi:signal transduction histidine kinase
LNRIAPNPPGSELGVDIATPARPVPPPEQTDSSPPAGLIARLRSLPATLPPGIAVVVVPVCGAAAAVLALALSRGVDVLWGAPIALVVAAVLSEALPVPIEGVAAGATSFSDVFIAAAAVLYGWRVGAMVGALTMLLVELYTRRPLLRLIYNSSLYVLAGAAAGVVGDAVSDRYRTGLLSSLAFYVVDIALLCLVVARTRNEPYHRVARGFYASTSLPFVVNAATTGILYRLWQESPYWGLLLAPPLVAIIGYQRSLMAAVRRQRELDSLKDEFIAVISHELRTPLASVYGGAVTLEQRELDAPTQKRLISVVRRESARLAKLVDDVLWASRLDAKKVLQPQEPCDPVAVATEVVTTAADLAPENVEVALGETGDDVPALAVDPEQLRRVLANLVDNAVKYSPDGGRVEVATTRVDGSACFTVRDEGIGIPEEARERIFEKFTRLDPQMTRGIGGTGLGLYICKELVGQMGGRIWVTSNEGRGSVFTFEIPGQGKGG